MIDRLLDFYDVCSGWVIALMWAAAALLLVVAVALPWYGFASKQCSDFGDRMDRRTELSVFSGCFVETNDGMVPLDNWRATQESSR